MNHGIITFSIIIQLLHETGVTHIYYVFNEIMKMHISPTANDYSEQAPGICCSGDKSITIQWIVLCFFLSTLIHWIAI